MARTTRLPVGGTPLAGVGEGTVAGHTPVQGRRRVCLCQRPRPT